MALVRITVIGSHLRGSTPPPSRGVITSIVMDSVQLDRRVGILGASIPIALGNSFTPWQADLDSLVHHAFAIQSSYEVKIDYYG